MNILLAILKNSSNYEHHMPTSQPLFPTFSNIQNDNYNLTPNLRARASDSFFTAFLVGQLFADVLQRPEGDLHFFPSGGRFSSALLSPSFQPSFEPRRQDPWFVARKREIKEAAFRDYSYSPPAVETKETSVPDFSSLKPHVVLGVSESEKDLKVITARWRQLAIQYHPDKPDGSTDKFQKIQKAYETLKKELEDTSYDFAGMDVEACVVNARRRIEELELRENRPSVKSFPWLLESWKKLDQALSAVPLNGKDREMEAKLLDYRKLARENVKFWEFRKKLAEFSFVCPQENNFRSFDTAQERLRDIGCLFGLKNKYGEWKSELCCLLRANLFLCDKQVALYRSQALIAIHAGDDMAALSIRQKVKEIRSKLSLIKMDFVATHELHAMHEAMKQERARPTRGPQEHVPPRHEENPKPAACETPSDSVVKNVRQLNAPSEPKTKELGTMLVAYQEPNAAPKTESRPKPEEQVSELEAIQHNLETNFDFFFPNERD